jgi:hypothetical protein
MPDLDPPAPAADPGPLPEQLPVVGAAGGRLDVAR